MKIKHIKFNTPDGIYAVKSEIIAVNKASFLWSKQYYINKEVEHLMNEDSECIDWLLNYMTYEDIEDDAFKISNKMFVTSDDFWKFEQDFEIIELEVD